MELGERRALVGLSEDRTDRRGHKGFVLLGHVGQDVAHSMDPTALPARPEQHAPYRLLEPFVGVADDQLHATQPTVAQAPQEAGPECSLLTRSDLHTQHPPLAAGLYPNGDDYGQRDNPSILAHF